MADRLTFTFENHFHPYVGEMVQQLNQKSVEGLLDLAVQRMSENFFDQAYRPGPASGDGDATFTVTAVPKNVDVSVTGPYSVYNWELFFHVPVVIAVHLSKNQRYVEAQRWFHHVFDPTVNDPGTPSPDRFWRFNRFRDPQPTDMPRVDELIAVLSQSPDQVSLADRALLKAATASYESLRREPFAPHRVARTRVVAYQYYVVMKYLDNLISWGDSLFRQDTAESINEATQLYVLAGNILGPAPAQVPRYARAPRLSYAQLRSGNFGSLFGNALVQLENQLPFASTPRPGAAATPSSGVPLLGMGKTTYFGVPRNDTLAGYWDTVADRLFKIRHCQDITGVHRQLALFAPPIDPRLLAKATAAGEDIAAAVAGIRGPAYPVRAATLVQKAMEMAAEVRSTGSALIAAMEKRDGEELARKRQEYEVEMAQLTRDVRFLAWREAEANTEALLKSRAITFARYRHFQHLLGGKESEINKLATVTLKRQIITEANFTKVFDELVKSYDLSVPLENRSAPQLAGDTDPQVQSGSQSKSSLDLITNESAELNNHMPRAAELQSQATDVDLTFSVLGMLPGMGIALFPIGVGGYIQLGGELLSAVGRTIATAKRGLAESRNYDGLRAAKIAAYQRRDLDFAQQSNQAALELMQNGRQLIASLIREQLASTEFENSKKQITKARAISSYLESKDTNTELYTWLYGEVRRSYAELYRMAVDVARAAEYAAKRELMRPELENTTFIGFSHWDSGNRGLQAGERLHRDLTRLQLAYLESNKREHELTGHVSLRSLDPVALLNLRSTGECQFEVPEWFFDLQSPGHYLRRIRSVSLSLPAVTGPYTAVSATLSLQRSVIRTDPGLIDGRYAHLDGEDSRFLHYPGTMESVVTSSGVNDAGLFEPAARDERYQPFEGAGAHSTWKLKLPESLRMFDYATISDAVLHVNYTARPGVRPEAVVADLRARFADASTRALTRIFSLRHDFPSAWAAFLANPADGVRITIDRSWFPYFTQAEEISLARIDLHAVVGDKLLTGATPTTADDLVQASAALAEGQFSITVPRDGTVVTDDADADPHVIVVYTIPAPD